jgi:hypothetical protein
MGEGPVTEALSTRTEFDYGCVQAGEVNNLRQVAVDIRRMTSDLGRHGWAIGDRLRTAQRLVPVGQFGAWLAVECDGYTVRTAYRLIKLRQTYETPDLITFSQTAALVLAEDGVPEEAREEARRRAAAGETITEQKAAEIADSYAPHGTGKKPRTQSTRTAREKREKSARSPSGGSPATPAVVTDPVTKDSPVVIETTATVVEEQGETDEKGLRDQLIVLRTAAGRMKESDYKEGVRLALLHAIHLLSGGDSPYQITEVA